MSNANTPACPLIESTTEYDNMTGVSKNISVVQYHAGLTKREHYAGVALQGILAGLPVNANYDASVSAESAVKHADALLKALEKQEQPA